MRRRRVYGTYARFVRGRGEPGGQRPAQFVGRVDVAAEHDHGDVGGPGPLERGGRDWALAPVTQESSRSRTLAPGPVRSAENRPTSGSRPCSPGRMTSPVTGSRR